MENIKIYKMTKEQIKELESRMPNTEGIRKLAKELLHSAKK